MKKLLILTVLVLAGCIDESQPTPEFVDVNKMLAQAYFNLGVSCADLINARRRLAGQEQLSGQELYVESTKYALGEGVKLIELPK